MVRTENDYIKVDFIEVSQPIGKFYVASINHYDLLNICYADIREIQHEGDFETYLGIQRELSSVRIKNLSTYVNLYDASFPTGIILSISNKVLGDEYGKFQQNVDEIFNINYTVNIEDASSIERNIYIDEFEGQRKLFIYRDDKVAKIIDGQHRIEGLKNYRNADKPFQLNVTIFVDMEIEEQAMVFATINKAQTKVNKSIVYDLYDLATSRSPQKTCHNIAKFLNLKDGSPFRDLIKLLGTADNKEEETITQATFVECLIDYISKEPLKDRDLLLRKDKIKKVEGKELKRYFLRNLFIEEKDAEIAKIIYNYFNVVKDRWKSVWEKPVHKRILNKSTGVVALFKFFGVCYLYLCSDTRRNDKGEEEIIIDYSRIGKIFEESDYKPIFDKITLISDEFNTDKYIPGNIGRKRLYDDLIELSGIGKP